MPTPPFTRLELVWFTINFLGDTDVEQVDFIVTRHDISQRIDEVRPVKQTVSLSSPKIVIEPNSNHLPVPRPIYESGVGRMSSVCGSV